MISSISPKDELNKSLVRRDDSEEFKKEMKKRESDYAKDLDSLSLDSKKDKKLSGQKSLKQKKDRR